MRRAEPGHPAADHGDAHGLLSHFRTPLEPAPRAGAPPPVKTTPPTIHPSPNFCGPCCGWNNSSLPTSEGLEPVTYVLFIARADDQHAPAVAGRMACSRWDARAVPTSGWPTGWSPLITPCWRWAPSSPITDLDSRNGTRVGERVIPAFQPIQIRPGEAVWIGETLLMIASGADQRRPAAVPGSGESQPDTRVSLHHVTRSLLNLCNVDLNLRRPARGARLSGPVSLCRSAAGSPGTARAMRSDPRCLRPTHQKLFRARFLCHLPELRARASRLSRSASDADDLVQQTLEKALRCSASLACTPTRAPGCCARCSTCSSTFAARRSGCGR